MLIIEIDTGAKPPAADRGMSASGVLEPLRAMTNVGFTVAESTRKQYLNEIRTAIEQNETPTDLPFRSYTFVCIRSDDAAVMTAWALGSDDKGSVIRSFLLDDQLWNARWPDLYREMTQRKQSILASQEVLDVSADRKRLTEEKMRSIRKK